MQHALMDTEVKLSRLLARSGLDTTRLWTESFEYSWEPDTLFEMQTKCGSQQRRLHTLPEEKRDTCRERVRQGLAGLSPDQLVYRPGVVFAVARRAHPR
jgi:hypothetical protein